MTQNGKLTHDTKQLARDLFNESKDRRVMVIQMRNVEKDDEESNLSFLNAA